MDNTDITRAGQGGAIFQREATSVNPKLNHITFISPTGYDMGLLSVTNPATQIVSTLLYHSKSPAQKAPVIKISFKYP